jgi:hypothetical protein
MKKEKIERLGGLGRTQASFQPLEALSALLVGGILAALGLPVFFIAGFFLFTSQETHLLRFKNLLVLTKNSPLVGDSS